MHALGCCPSATHLLLCTLCLLQHLALLLAHCLFALARLGRRRCGALDALADLGQRALGVRQRRLRLGDLGCQGGRCLARRLALLLGLLCRRWGEAVRAAAWRWNSRSPGACAARRWAHGVFRQPPSTFRSWLAVVSRPNKLPAATQQAPRGKTADSNDPPLSTIRQVPKGWAQGPPTRPPPPTHPRGAPPAARRKKVRGRRSPPPPLTPCSPPARGRPRRRPPAPPPVQGQVEEGHSKASRSLALRACAALPPPLRPAAAPAGPAVGAEGAAQTGRLTWRRETVPPKSLSRVARRTLWVSLWSSRGRSMPPGRTMT
jgi:hypothetical protein